MQQVTSRKKAAPRSVASLSLILASPLLFPWLACGDNEGAQSSDGVVHDEDAGVLPTQETGASATTSMPDASSTPSTPVSVSSTPAIPAAGGAGANPIASTSMGGTSGASGGSGASGESSGASNNGGAAGSMGGSPSMDAGTGGSAPDVIDCSEQTLRTGPPPGKELFRTAAVDDVFPFEQHYMGTFSDDPRYVSMTSLTDIDNDGDLDFASGQRQDLGGGMVWWEYCTPDHWVRHTVGTGHTSAAGGNALDVDADGWVDLLAGDSWYRNPGNPRDSEWERFSIGAPGAEELIVGDVTGDGRGDVLWVWRSIDPLVMTPSAEPEEPWDEVVSFSHRQQQGGAIGDIDGDGDNDILVGNEWWYRNADGEGGSWEDVNIAAGAEFDDEPLTYLGDMDGDGDIDLLMATHFGGRIAWLSNGDDAGGGDGSEFTLRFIVTDKEFLHSIVGADFDNDGDVDVFAGQNVGPAFIFENDGAGNFTEHVIAQDTRGHEARVGDVDCDGDLDIAGKPWGDPSEGGEVDLTTRDHVYFRNMLVERGGPAQFERTPGEVVFDVQDRDCR